MLRFFREGEVKLQVKVVSEGETTYYVPEDKERVIKVHIWLLSERVTKMDNPGN